MAVTFTPQQQNAIDSRGGALIVSAAAGSGKTAVLVERVIRRITDPQDPVDIDGLLIVTFTNAAAAEMRERIADRLLAQLAEEPGSRRLRRQLALLGGARIQTVHAFCLDLVRQNFTQCGVNPGFRLLDTAESQLLKEQAMEEMLEEQYADQDPDFLAALDNFAEERGDRKLQQVVMELYEGLRSHVDPAGWLEQAIQTAEYGAHSQPEELEWCQDLLRYVEEQTAYLEGRLLAAYRQLEEVPEVLAKYGPAFEQCLVGGRQIRQAAGQGWDACFEALRQFSKPRLAAVRGADKGFTDRMKEARDAFCAGIEQLAAEAVSRPGSQVRRELAASLPILRGLRDLEQAFERFYGQGKKRRNALDFSDLEHLAIGLLVDRKTGEQTLLARQLAEGIQEILVDEYQDTNEIQDCLFQALRRPGNSLFLVGDVKQSIYRFRLAEPEIFVEKYYAYQDYEQDPEAPRKRLMLNQNFRSRWEVLELTNFLCRRTMTRRFGGVDYDEREELRPGEPYPYQGPCPAEVYLLDKKREEGEEDAPEWAVYEAEFVAEAIQWQLQNGQVTDKGQPGSRPARPEDVAVLLSSFSNKAPLYQQALERRGIPCTAGGGADLFASIEAAVLRSLLAVIDNPRQDIPLISVLRSPLYLFTPDELLEIRQQDRKGQFYDGLLRSDSPHVRQFLEDLRLFRSHAPDMSVGQLVALIYSRTGALGVFQALDNGPQRKRNLQRFYQLALQYESGGSRGLFEFLQMLEKKAQEGDVAEEPAPGAVRLMSVHKSKGLEFPIVVVPDLSKRFNTDDLRQPMLLHKKVGLAFRLRDVERRTEQKTQMQAAIQLRHRAESREEELRKLYVAMTRAREKLILTMALPDAQASLRRWEELCDEEGCLAPGAAADQSSAAMWVAAPLLRHPDGQPLREYAGLPLALPAQDARRGGLVCRVVPFDRKWMQAGEEGGQDQAPPEQLTMDMPRFQALQDFVYPHLEATKLPSKLTPTGVQQLAADSAQLEWQGERAQPRIQMYRTESRDQAARMGTLVHRCMQLVDLARCQTAEGAAAELKRLVEDKQVEEEALQIGPQAIARFAASPLGRRAEQAQCLREYQFSALFTPKELGVGQGEEEEILMNGIIDLLLLEEDGAWVVDFKSDAVAPGKEPFQAKRYEKQLDIYAKAVEKIMEVPVRGRTVYFLATGAGVEVGPPRQE
ncbi:MAG TPA: helicase-exonuclease AddAB subunit AddA [Firmicutes bacterium]|nr:helicase-exonuclease AddAB subunit AddA [Bacillota bacterium]